MRHQFTQQELEQLMQERNAHKPMQQEASGRAQPGAHGTRIKDPELDSLADQILKMSETPTRR